MHAIIKTGGKQYRVTEGQELTIEKITEEIGQPVKFNEVLMITGDNAIHVGSPYLPGAVVTAEVVNQGRGDKINIVKFRRRKHHLKRTGHRQYLTAVKITGITVGEDK